MVWNKRSNPLRPITIISSRYRGVYEGAKFLAFNLNFFEIPDAVYGDDISCCDWFCEESVNYQIGKGSTPDEAYNDLLNITKKDPI